MKSYSVCFSVSYFTEHNTLYMHPCHNGKVSFFLWLIFHCIYIYIYIYIHTHTHTSHLLYPSIYQWVLRPFHILPTVNNAAKNIEVHIPFWISIFVFFGKISKSGIVRFYGSSNFFLISILCIYFTLQYCIGFAIHSSNFLRHLHTPLLHSGCTNLQSYQQCVSVPISPHSCQHLWFVVFLRTAVHSDRCEVSPLMFLHSSLNGAPQPGFEDSLSHASLGEKCQRKSSSVFIWFRCSLFPLIGSCLRLCVSTRLEKKGKVVFKSSLSSALAWETQQQCN